MTQEFVCQDEKSRQEHSDREAGRREFVRELHNKEPVAVILLLMERITQLEYRCSQLSRWATEHSHLNWTGEPVLPLSKTQQRDDIDRGLPHKLAESRGLMSLFTDLEIYIKDQVDSSKESS